MAITYPTQPHSHPRRYQGTTIDIHAHWYPAEWIKLFERDGAKYGTGVQRGADGYALTTGKISNKFTEELGWTIFLHPVDTVGKERMTKFYLRNLCGNPYDTGIAAAHIIFGGVLDAFPKLGFNLPHAGGTFPALIGRWDHGTKMRPELKHMKRMPSEYLRRFTYDTMGHSDTINMNLVRMVGADRVTLGSDYCFDMGLEHPHDTVEGLAALSDADRDLILGKNAAGLLGIA